MSRDPARAAPAVRMTLWRDREPEAMRIPGMFAGSGADFGDPLEAVSDLSARGVQFAQLPDPVDLADADGAAAVAALVIIRELTSYGIAIEWQLRMPAQSAGQADWRVLSHLYPPATVIDRLGSEDIAAQWRDSYHAAKCGYRHGPGFIEIRDRRRGSFKRMVIRNSQRDQGIQSLLRGVPASAVPEQVASHYLREDLLHQAGRFLWWTPYRIRRWPLTTMIP